MTEEKKPLRLSEVQREMQTGGLKCPKCQCVNFRVASTWHSREGVRRARVCRNCGTRLISTENF
jgi:hypothetical protein